MDRATWISQSVTTYLTRKADGSIDGTLSDVQLPLGAELPRQGLTFFHGMKSTGRSISDLHRAATRRGESVHPVQVQIRVAIPPQQKSAGARLTLGDIRDFGKECPPRQGLLSIGTATKEVKDAIRLYMHDQAAFDRESVVVQFPQDQIHDHYNRFAVARADLFSKAIATEILFKPFGAFSFEVKDGGNNYFSFLTILNPALITGMTGPVGVELVLPDAAWVKE